MTSEHFDLFDGDLFRALRKPYASEDDFAEAEKAFNLHACEVLLNRGSKATSR